MLSSRPTAESIARSMSRPSSIRNVCILAHVDHGKTTISDSLLATNGLISKRSAGQVRYLDDRPDEQERGITMKSSAVSLYYQIDNDRNEKVDMLLNLIDTPGHIDFSTEVSAAVRICDGALIVVDVVEGICVQTKDAIKQAYDEKIEVILVLNKLDRLIVELHKSVEEIFQVILRVIEDCNAYVAELSRYKLEVNEEEDAFFCPEKGNVIFASAIDGWGFTLKQIAEMFLGVVENETVEDLVKKMWDFDCYINSSRKIVRGAAEKKKDNLFIQLCVKTVHYIYFTLVNRMEREKLDVILKKLNITTVTREMKHNDPRVQVKAILQAWKPLATTIMEVCYRVVPSPDRIKNERLEYLVNLSYCEEEVSDVAEAMIRNFKDFENTEPVVAYVSKMFSLNKKCLSQFKPKMFVPSVEERALIIKARKEAELKTINENSKNFNEKREVNTIGEINENNGTNQGEKINEDKIKSNENENINSQSLDNSSDSGIRIIGLAKVFSGTLKIGQEVYIIPPKYTPNKIEKDNLVKITIKELYMLLGRELIFTETVPSGNICGIGGIEAAVLRTATLSTTTITLPLVNRASADPIVRNSIEPVNPKHLPILRKGLKQLMQSDSCIQILMQETGELVLLTAGDVHLAKCLEDLKSKFADIEINVSKPMVSLRETIISQKKHPDFNNLNLTVTCELSNFIISIIAVPLPEELIRFVMKNYDFLRLIEEHQQKSIADIIVEGDVKQSKLKIFKNEHTNTLLTRLKEQLRQAFENCKNPWINMYEKIWSIGKNKDTINLLFNHVEDYKNGNIFKTLDENDPRSYLDNTVINAFDMCCKSGPMCEEPISNCAFVITSFKLEDREGINQILLNLPSTLKATFRQAFEKQQMRLMEPIFTTDIQVNTNILGKVYSVINKKHGKVLDAVGMDEQEKTFLVKAQIPVVESDGFANEIRKATSGQAYPNLRFSHYEIVEGDPFFEPDSEEEDEDDAIVDLAARASRLLKDVRRRKGLSVDEQIVVHAEKQRTLNKKK